MLDYLAVHLPTISIYLMIIQLGEALGTVLVNPQRHPGSFLKALK